MAIAKATGYSKWFNAAAADIARMKIGDAEKYNHYSNNPKGKAAAAGMVLNQVHDYDAPNHPAGHLYGAIIARVRLYQKPHKREYLENQLAYCAHYVGDLSQPLHNMVHDDFNKKRDLANDGIVNTTIFENHDKIIVFPVKIDPEHDLVKEIVWIANIGMALGYRLEEEIEI